MNENFQILKHVAYILFVNVAPVFFVIFAFFFLFLLLKKRVNIRLGILLTGFALLIFVLSIILRGSLGGIVFNVVCFVTLVLIGFFLC